MTQASASEIAVMLSVGRHPTSHRQRASHADRRAVGIAHRANVWRVMGVHAGELHSHVAYDYFAVGLGAIQALEKIGGADPLPVLMSWWRDRRPAITLFGDKAEQGESSGMLPYFFAEKLRMPLISGVVSIARSGDQFEVLQALSASLRRAIVVRPPFVAVSSPRTPLPLRFSHAAARHSHSEVVSLTPADDTHSWTPAPIISAVIRPMALRSDIGCTLEQRLSALMGGDRRVRQRYLNSSAEAAAEVIVGALKSLDLWTANSSPPDPSTPAPSTSTAFRADVLRDVD